MKIKFIEDGLIDGELTFKKGQTYDLSIDSCNRWLRRGKAIEAAPEKEDVKPIPKVEEKSEVAQAPSEVHTELEVEKPVEEPVKKGHAHRGNRK